MLEAGRGDGDVTCEPLSTRYSGKSAFAYQGLLQARGEPGASRLPIALDGDHRHVQRGGDVFLRAARRKSAVHHAGCSRIDLFERREERCSGQLLARRNVVQDVNAG